MPASRIRVLLLVGIAAPAVLSACSTGPTFIAKNEPWRLEEERACLASGVVRESGFIRTRAALGGPSVCGAEHPFEMAAADNGRVLIKPVAYLRCPMIPQVDRWVTTVVQPAARRMFGLPVTQISIAGSYACRAINHVSGGILSEHGHANAIDVSGFTLADGSRITVKRGWNNGDLRARAFLREVHDGACAQFTTVLGPEYNSLHRDHFHLDLARRGHDGLRTVCK
jgi:hypothetical protein